MKKMISIMCGALLACCAVAQSAVVVDTDFSISHESIDGYDVNTDFERFRDWSDSTLMYDGSAANGTKIYGGIRITADSGVGGYVGINTNQNAMFARPVPQDAVTTNSATQVFYLWDATDFLTPGVTAFDETANSSFFVSMRYLHGLTGGLRFVIREGGTYYVANQTALNVGVSFATATLSGDQAGLQWASFNPADFDLFTDTDANLGFGSVSFSSRTFTNVTGMGMIANAVAPGYTQVVVTDFQATLSDGSPPVVPVTLHGLFTDRMILQRDENVAVYGGAYAGDVITVSISGQTKTATTDVDGKWKVYLDPMSGSFTPQSLTVSRDGNLEITLSDILVGDVWVVSGQSNMDRWIMAYPIVMDDIRGVSNDQVRIFRSDNALGSLTPREEVAPYARLDGSWQVAEETYLTSFSPAGYYFAKRLNQELNIPIGIIQAGRGATTIESWLPSWMVAAEQDYEYMLGDQWSENVMTQSEIDAGAEMALRGTSGLYNYVVAPLREFTFKGFGWCQGESNARRPYIYRRLMPEMISAWRQDFDMPNAPFLVVEIAPYGGYNYERAAWLRDAQTYALTQPNVGFVTTIDSGEYEDIHPQAKEVVGDRMAYLALEMDGLPYSGVFPSYESMVISGNTIELKFSNAESLGTQEVRMNHYPFQPIGQGSNVYVVAAGTVAGFEICGADELFVDADAVISGGTLVVSAPSISSPVAVRYAWKNFPLANLTSGDGHPVRPFRTDDFVSPFDPPVFNTPVFTETVDVNGGAYSADLSAVDPNGDTLTYSVVSYSGAGADWLTMDPDTGIMSGTPAVTGAYHWVVAVKDEAFNDRNSFNKVYAEVNLSVTNSVNEPPVITLLEPGTNVFAAGTDLYIKAEVTDNVRIDRVNLWVNTETVKVIRDNDTTTYQWGGPSATNDPNGLLSGLTNGTYALRILAWDNVGELTRLDFTVTILPPQENTAFLDWIDSFELGGSDAELLANPDGDAFNNLLEYALGGNPTNTLNEELIIPELEIVEQAESSLLRYTFPRRIDASAFGLKYIIEHKATLDDEAWETNGVAETSVATEGVPAGFELVTVAVEVLGEYHFIRLTIEYN